MNDFPKLLQTFFTDRLIRQRQVSKNTIASYRDTFRILFDFAQKYIHKQPSELKIEELNSSFIAKFLTFLEEERGNSARSRNVRLAAYISFFDTLLYMSQYIVISFKEFYQYPLKNMTASRLIICPHLKSKHFCMLLCKIRGQVIEIKL